MSCSAKQQWRSILHRAGLLGAISLNLTSMRSSFAQDEETVPPVSEVEEAPPPPLPALTPPAVPVPPAVAPPGVPTAEDDEKPEELIVTGSRVRRADLNAPAPITTLDRQKIERVGRGSVGEILQQLPSQANGINVQFNNGGTGATRVNLRGLDAERTLVLLNGRRFVAGGTGANASVDLNAIPLSVIERIEVLKDGASAVYGSDAIGGVVNIITRRDFSGVETSLYTGAGQHGGVVYLVSATAGEVTDKAGLLFSFEYFNQSDMFAGDREFSEVSKTLDFQTFEERTDGSSRVPQGRIFDRSESPGNAAWRAVLDTLPEGGRRIFYNDPVKGWRPFNSGGTSDTGEGDLYNFQPENYLLTPQERYNLFTVGHYDLFPNVRGYFEGSYTNRRSEQLLAPEPFDTFNSDPRFVVSAQNLYDPFARGFTDVRRRMVEASNRTGAQDVDTYRVVLGLDGGLPDGLGMFSDWRWDGHFIYGRTEATDITRGSFVASRLQNALGPSFTDASSGVASCGTGPDDVIAGCVPLDLFGGVGSITREMLDYISYDGTARGFSEQQIWGIDANGPIFTLLNDAAGLAVGYQYRREAGGFLPDPITGSGDSTTNAQGTTGGDFSVNAAYAELVIPIRLGVPGIEAFELNAAARWVDFSSFGSELTWKFGGRWQVLEHVALRGTGSRSFRAPSVAELFGGPTDSYPNVSDPCDTSRGPLEPEVGEACAAQDVPANHFDIRSQLRTTVGGNPDLDAETANVFTAGIVITPKFGRWTEGLSLTVDYWTISIEDAIQSITANVILSNCFRRPFGERTNCDLVKRAADGNITNIIDTQTNLGGVDTAGLDFGLSYRLPTDFGRFGLSFDATWLQSFDVTQSDGSVIEGVGTYDLRGFGGLSSGVFAEVLFNAAFNYGIENFGLGVNMRYVGPIRECEDNACRVGQLKPGQPPPRSRNVASFVTTDVFASYRLSSPLGVTSIGAGINNVTDAEPPLLYNGFTANSDPAAYDFIGRYFYFRLSQAF